MIGYILTEEEKTSIQSKFFSNCQFFSCAKDINGIWFVFLNSEEAPLVATSIYSSILNCPKGEYVAPPNPLFT